MHVFHLLCKSMEEGNPILASFSIPEALPKQAAAAESYITRSD